MSKQSYLKRFTAICAVAAAGMVLGATSDLPVLDSSKFDFKYEMDVLPTEQDLDNDGYKDFTGGSAWLTLVGGGIARFDMSASSAYIQSSAATGADGCVWRRYAPTAATGYTIEVRMRVLSQNQGSSLAVGLAASEGSNNDALLSLDTYSFGWENNPRVELARFATTNAFHTYRIAKIPSENRFALWCDDNFVTNGLSDALVGYNGLNRLLLGAIGGSYRSVVDVDYLRFTKGAYAPKPPAGKDSADFPHKYEMNSVDEGFSPTSSTAEWTLNSGEDGTAVLENGILSVLQPKGIMRYWLTTGPMDPSGVTGSSFTFETRLRITDSWSSSGNALHFLLGVSGLSCAFFINRNAISWRTTQNAEAARFAGYNDDKMHVFRVTGFAGNLTLWRDGEKLGDHLSIYSTDDAGNSVRFGIVSTSSGGSFDIDYIRWTTDGAFVPATPKKGTMITFR